MEGLVPVQDILQYMENDRYMSVAAAAEYLGVSTKTLRGWMKEGLPYYVKGGKTLLRRSECDEWMQRWRCHGSEDLEQALELAADLIDR